MIKKDKLRIGMQNYVGDCQSPIESMLATALLYQIGVDMVERSGPPPFKPVEPVANLVTQHRIGDYKVDLALVGADIAVAIECDGHDFHEKTREQAARDKARDRAITAAGFAILRFTGSEIWADPIRCAEEAFAVAKDQLSRVIELQWTASRA